jgi:uncharacterized RDD family membrane protein YckC
MINKNTQQARNGVPSAWVRIKASLIDYLVILAWMATIGLAGLVISLLLGGYPDFLGILGPIAAQVLFFFVLTFPVGVYLYVAESGTRHATIGKRKMGMWVSGLGGGTPSRWNIFLRALVKLLPWEIAHTFIWQMQYVFYQSGYEADVPEWIFIGLNVAIVSVIIYVAMIALRKDGRAPHDLVAGTRVVLS